MNEAHLRAVFLILAGENVAAVSAQSGICRTSLYKLRRRRRRAATDAVRREIEHKTKRIRISGLMYFNGRRVYISPGLLAGEKIKIFETLNGLEAEDENSKLYFLPDYKTKICRPLWHYSNGAWQDDVSIYYFKLIGVSKRLETENQMLRVEETDGDGLNCGSSDKICARSAVAYRL